MNTAAECLQESGALEHDQLVQVEATESQPAFVAKFLYANADRGGPFVCVRELDHKHRPMGVRFVKPSRVKLFTEPDVLSPEERREGKRERDRARRAERRQEMASRKARISPRHTRMAPSTGHPERVMHDGQETALSPGISRAAAGEYLASAPAVSDATAAERARRYRARKKAEAQAGATSPKRGRGQPAKTSAEKRRRKTERQQERRAAGRRQAT